MCLELILYVRFEVITAVNCRCWFFDAPEVGIYLEVQTAEKNKKNKTGNFFLQPKVFTPLPILQRLVVTTKLKRFDSKQSWHILMYRHSSVNTIVVIKKEVSEGEIA